MKIDSLFRNQISKTLLAEYSIVDFEEHLARGGAGGHKPFMDIFFRACTSDEERRQMVCYFDEMGKEFLASKNFLGDNGVSRFNLRNLYTLKLLWPEDCGKRLCPAVDGVLRRLAEDPDQFNSDFQNARIQSQATVCIEGARLLSRFDGAITAEDLSGGLKLLIDAMGEYLGDVDGPILRRRSITDFVPLLSVPVGREWVLVAYFQRISSFAQGAEVGFDIQTAITRVDWLDKMGGRVPIPHGLMKIYIRESMHGMRGAYMGAGSVAEILAGAKNYAIAIKYILPLVRKAILIE